MQFTDKTKVPRSLYNTYFNNIVVEARRKMFLWNWGILASHFGFQEEYSVGTVYSVQCSVQYNIQYSVQDSMESSVR